MRCSIADFWLVNIQRSTPSHPAPALWRSGSFCDAGALAGDAADGVTSSEGASTSGERGGSTFGALTSGSGALAATPASTAASNRWYSIAVVMSFSASPKAGSAGGPSSEACGLDMAASAAGVLGDAGMCGSCAGRAGEGVGADVGTGRGRVGTATGGTAGAGLVAGGCAVGTAGSAGCVGVRTDNAAAAGEEGCAVGSEATGERVIGGGATTGAAATGGAIGGAGTDDAGSGGAAGAGGSDGVDETGGADVGT